MHDGIVKERKLNFFAKYYLRNKRLRLFETLYKEKKLSYLLEIPPKKVSPEAGHCWTFTLPGDFPKGDDKLYLSNTVLFEDGLPLGPAHTLHDEIRMHGGGCFSHWASSLFFSTSDNSDPRLNKRKYSVAVESQSSTNEFDLSPLKEVLDNAQKNPFIPGRVLLVNAGLAAGGAERQIINTLMGLKKQPLESVMLLCLKLGQHKDLDFYLHHLESKHIEVLPVPLHYKSFKEGLEIFEKPIADYLRKLPNANFVVEIINLIAEFKRRRPEIVHAWQDDSSIKCGIAGLIAGVPKIILSSRNVPPFNFALYQPYMLPGYCALKEFDRIIFVNNSEKGAQEYCRWLDLPLSRFNVIRNGVDFSYLSVADNNNLNAVQIAAWRKELGIPGSADVIGSVFRFYEEKRPLLWIQAAIEIAVRLPESHFLLVGDGQIREEMESLVIAHGLEFRFHFLGYQVDISRIVPLMDIFLLTSVLEGTPNSLLEAQWLGIPVIAAEGGGTREAVWDGTTGIVVSQTSQADKISDVVIETLSDQEWRKKVKKKGPEFVNSRYSLERMIKETMELYGHHYKDLTEY